MAAAAILPLSTQVLARGTSSGAQLQSMRADLVEKAALVVPEIPTLINMVSKRVKQLTQGRPALIERKPGMREADVALQEIIEGKIRIEHPEEIL
jgi:DNA-directed RNA polymerase subunit omega